MRTERAVTSGDKLSTMMRELGPPLQSAAMTMLWVNSGAEVADDRVCKTQSLYYGTSPDVARPRVKGLRISMLQVGIAEEGRQIGSFCDICSSFRAFCSVAE